MDNKNFPKKPDNGGTPAKDKRVKEKITAKKKLAFNNEENSTNCVLYKNFTQP